jgi:NADH:ubiquinone oxidoreductase subunit 5 (subunit L)/multisubunit Na+/H+ antiporter MnhA subunit
MLFISSITGTIFNCSKMQIQSVIFAFVMFLLSMFLPDSVETLKWFSINSLTFEFSMNFATIELIVCSIVCSILLCLHIAKSSVKKDENLNRKFGLINLFAFFMCFSVLSKNLFQFFIGIEALGIISSVFVSLEKDSIENSNKTFIFNKFASLMFMIGIFLIAANVGSFDIQTVEQFCVNNKTALFVPTCFILISCLCKGAQFPFSYWLLDASKANIFASILIHAVTIVAIGIILIAKCYFLFEYFPLLKNIMVISGLTTAFWLSTSALFHNNIKKIMACLTCCSAGFMFIACGLGEYSLAILYFICHAFFKSALFLSFYYVIYVMAGEQNILRMGGINSVVPKVSDIVWISFATAVGFPFLVGFFAKISFMSTIQLSRQTFLEFSNIIINIIYTAAIFRTILLSMYGKSRANEAVFGRVSHVNLESIVSVWLLLIFSIMGAFICWILYEWGELHFGYAGIVYIREFFDYFIENITELIQIGLAIVLVLFLLKCPIIKKTSYLKSFMFALFKNYFIYHSLYKLLKDGLCYIFKFINDINIKINKVFTRNIFYTIYTVAGNFQNLHKNSIHSHLFWMLIGIMLNFLGYVYWRIQ